MAADKATLASSLKTAFATAIGVDDGGTALTNAIADAIDVYYKSGTGVTNPADPLLDSVSGAVTGTVKMT